LHWRWCRSLHHGIVFVELEELTSLTNDCFVILLVLLGDIIISSQNARHN
jgi:hypothetical protein